VGGTYVLALGSTTVRSCVAATRTADHVTASPPSTSVLCRPLYKARRLPSARRAVGLCARRECAHGRGWFRIDWDVRVGGLVRLASASTRHANISQTGQLEPIPPARHLVAGAAGVY